MERTQFLAPMAALVVAASLLGCGKPAPELGNFKRSPDPVAPSVPTVQANPTALPTTPAAAGQAAPVSSSPAAVVAPALPAAESIQIEPVDAAWPPEKKLEQTIARLKKISLAMCEYAGKQGRFPPAPGQKHSWRVLLLPYLGHAEQFAKFNLQESWDSPANIEAAKEVPPVYQSPWRSDALTCFLAPLGVNTMLASPVGVEAARLNDQWGSIVELLMVDDEFAVAWSQPADFVLAASDPPTGSLGRERGGYLVVLANGEVRWLPSSVAGRSAVALMTIGGHEFASPAVLTQGPQAALPFLSIAATTGSAGSPAGTGAEPKPAGTPPAPAIAAALTPQQDDVRLPLPDEAETEQARSLLKQVFKEELERTKKGDKTRSKHDLAEVLLNNAQKVEAEPAAHFVLLQTARDNAAAVGDFKLAQQATTALVARYQVNDLDLRRRTVTESAEALLPNYEQQSDDLRTECVHVLKLALQHDDFVAAKQLLAVLTETTRRQSNRQDLLRLQSIEREVDDFKKAYASIPPAIKVLEQSPGDPDANYTLGAHLCLVKLRWTDGAAHLAKGSNLRLKVLATEDIARPVGPIGMVNLANEYWTLSELETGLFKRGLQLRAVYWYRLALPDLSAGLAKLQAERRSAEANKNYGESLVKEALAIMAGPEAITTTAAAVLD